MKIVPPAHKHVGDVGKPGQTVYGFDRHPYLKTPKVQTLGDYVKKVVKEESNTQPEGAQPVAWGSGDGYWVRAEDKPARPDAARFNIAFYGSASSPAVAHKKLTFDEWHKQKWGTWQPCYAWIDRKFIREIAFDAWKAAQENK